jgi:hypothetical protein
MFDDHVAHVDFRRHQPDEGDPTNVSQLLGLHTTFAFDRFPARRTHLTGS